MTVLNKKKTLAKIGDNEVEYDVCCESRKQFQKQEDSGDFTYLGKGTICEINGVRQSFTNPMHFWKRKDGAAPDLGDFIL